jgi:nicotinamidase/pyrazinamidase
LAVNTPEINEGAADVPVGPRAGDALVVVDLQRDFLPGGALAVPDGNAVIEPLNRYLELFHAASLPVFATRDWHPENHGSFVEQGGRWPRHCVANTRGAQFPAELRLPDDVEIVSKATDAARESYSGFDGTDLDARLRRLGVGRLFVGGLATEFCVLATVRDALARNYRVCLLRDAVRPLDSLDGQRAVEEMVRLGARPVCWQDVARSTV